MLKSYDGSPIPHTMYIGKGIENGMHTNMKSNQSQMTHVHINSMP